MTNDDAVSEEITQERLRLIVEKTCDLFGELKVSAMEAYMVCTMMVDVSQRELKEAGVEAFSRVTALDEEVH